MKLTNYENILHPLEAFREYQSNLFPLYIEDYGEEYLQLIQGRMRRTVYLFDDMPYKKLNFIIENNIKLTASEMKLLKKTCQDYLRKADLIRSFLEKRFYFYVGSAFDVGCRYLRELYDLDIDSFSAESLHILSSNNFSVEEKTEILSRQECYLKECERLRVKAVTDPDLIDILYEISDRYEQKFGTYILGTTKWGRSIREKIYRQTGVKVSVKELASIFFGTVDASSSIYWSKKGKTAMICYVPVVDNFLIGRVDNTVFHENRHVIEVGNFCTGLEFHPDSRYSALNEIRTYLNECSDGEKLADKVLFSKSEGIYTATNIYSLLLPYVDDFFSKNKKQLNLLAIENDYEKFERLYGKDTLLEFDNYLSEIMECLLENSNLLREKVDTRKQKQLLKSLDEHYQMEVGRKYCD